MWMPALPLGRASAPLGARKTGRALRLEAVLQGGQAKYPGGAMMKRQFHTNRFAWAYSILAISVLAGCSFPWDEQPLNCYKCSDAQYKAFAHKILKYGDAELLTVDSGQSFYITVSVVSPLGNEKLKDVVGVPSSLGCGCAVNIISLKFSKGVIFRGDSLIAGADLVGNPKQWALLKAEYPGELFFDSTFTAGRGDLAIYLSGRKIDGSGYTDTVRLTIK